MVRHWSISWMVVGLLSLSACVGTSSPPTRFFLLTASSAEHSTFKGEVKQKKSGLMVELEPVEIPQYLNRPEMVTRTSGNRLQLERMNQWAGDFKEDIGRVLMENLSRILSSDRVVILPSRNEGIPDFRLMGQIHRFEPVSTGQIVLDARWSLMDGHGKQLMARLSRITTQADDKEDYESMAAAMSQALDLWSREIGGVILKLHPPHANAN